MNLPGSPADTEGTGQDEAEDLPDGMWYEASDVVVPDHPLCLRERVVSSMRGIARPDRITLRAGLKGARGYKLDEATVDGLQRTLEHDPGTLERNVDMMHIPPEGLWFEFPHAARTGGIRGHGQPHEVGVLVLQSPDDPDTFVVASACDLAPAEEFVVCDERDPRSWAGSVWTAPGMVAVSRGGMVAAAAEARARPLSGADAVRRLMARVHAYMPPGMAEEIMGAREIAQGDEAGEIRVRGQALADAMTECPFAFACILLLSSDVAVVGAPDVEDIRTLSWRIPVEGLLGRLARHVPGRRPAHGFVRKGPSYAPVLGYVPRPSEGRDAAPVRVAG